MPLDARVQALLAKGRDRDAAALAIRELGPQVLAYLSALLRSESDAREVFAQFAEDLWRGLPRFRGEASLRGWAYRIAWHASARFARDPYRQRGRRLETREASILAAEVLSSNDDVWRADQMAALRGRLAPEEQTLLILRVNRGLPWRDVALVLAQEGQPPPSEAALRKRFERLKEKLGKAAREQGLID
ncbi:MAG TPA: sigma-70 family RNA polymerase sigma factor [Anaeromyxobacteraceae bacterium]